MAGFPTRISRTALGPTKQNAAIGVIHPAKYIGAVETELAYWQVSGLSVAAPRAWALVTWDGATAVSLTAAGEAWDPNGASAPTVARTSAGVYTVTYAATYNDETGTAVSTNLLAASVTARGTTARIPTWEIASSRIITVYLFDAAGSAADASFFVQAF